jgi:hypothetical protein
MMSEHPSFRWPRKRSIKLWRYMDLSKFLVLLQTSTLYFARADTLGDPFEGSIPFKSLRYLPDTKLMSQLTKSAVTKTYISCWHMAEHESAAMWKLYSQSSDAICVQTTFTKLSRALPSWIYGGVVSYVDYDRHTIRRDNSFNQFLIKRRSFEHERELRAISRYHPSENSARPDCQVKEFGIAIPIDINSLIVNVFVSPSSFDWFKDAVEALATKYGLTAKVSQSSLNASPLF